MATANAQLVSDFEWYRLSKESITYADELAKLRLKAQDFATRWELQKLGTQPNVPANPDAKDDGVDKRDLEEWDVKNSVRPSLFRCPDMPRGEVEDGIAERYWCVGKHGQRD
jgi:hypothetical protein